jgi:hypothetical protein
LSSIWHDQVVVGSSQYTEFGVIKEVGEDDYYIWVENENGTIVRKSKRYGSWHRTKEKMLSYKESGKWTVIRTGTGWSATEWFSDAWATKNLLYLPEDAGPEATATIINVRLAVLRLEEYGRHQDRVKIEETQDELRRHREIFEQLSPEEQEESDVAKTMIDDLWMDWITEPERPFIVTGAAYNNGRLGHVDKLVALRLGIDITNKKRLRVNILGRAHRNYLRVELLDYQDLECEMAVKKATKGNGRGQWVVASANRPKKAKKFKWFDLEHEHGLSDVKDMDYPLSFFLDWHKKLSELM